MYLSGLLLVSIAVLISSAIVLLRRTQHGAIGRYQGILLGLTGLLVVRAGFLFATVLGGEAQTGAAIISEVLMLGCAIAILVLAIAAPLEKKVPAVTNDSAALSREAQLRSALDNTPDPIFVKDVEGRYILVNAASMREMDRPGFNPVGKRDVELWDAKTAALFVESDRRVLGGETVVVEQLISTPDGARVFLATKSPLRAADGKIVGIVGVARDISDRKRAESELIELQIALENAMPGIARVGADRRYLAANSAYEKMLGYEPHQLIGRPARDSVHPDDWPLMDELFERLQRDGRAEAEYRGVRADGSVFHKHVFLVKPRIPTMDGTYCFMRDITDRRRLEERNLRAQKIEAIGKLAGHMAHDLSNELTTILGSVDQLTIRLKNALHSDDPAWLAIENLNRASGDAANLARKLSAFGGPSPLPARRFDAAAALRSLEPMLRRVLGESVRVSISGCDDPALIDFEPTQFETMICQIASNARDVMPSGGAFEVFVEKINTTPESADPRERNNPRAGQQVQLRFVDNGLGMTDEVMRRLFEPFFTTKPAGRGLGLGLATIQNAVTRFGGSIEISSTLGRGTEVRVQLPLVNPSSDLQSRQVDTGRQSPRGETRNATILICETDPSIAESAHRTLAELGYSVRITNTGREALAEARQTSNRIDLLITETALPDMGGRQLADLARRLRPDLQVLFLSSSGDGPLTDSGYIEIGVNTLVKPFPPRELIDNVRAALGNHIVNGPINS